MNLIMGYLRVLTIISISNHSKNYIGILYFHDNLVKSGTEPGFLKGGGGPVQITS